MIAWKYTESDITGTNMTVAERTKCATRCICSRCAWVDPSQSPRPGEQPDYKWGPKRCLAAVQGSSNGGLETKALMKNHTGLWQFLQPLLLDGRWDHKIVSSREINEAFVVLLGKSGPHSIQNHYLVESTEKADNSEKSIAFSRNLKGSQNVMEAERTLPQSKHSWKPN